MKWSQSNQFTERRLDLGVDRYGVSETFPTVDDAVANDIGVCEAAIERLSQLALVDRCSRRFEYPLGHGLVATS
jgi:hypothetical protein